MESFIGSFGGISILSLDSKPPPVQILCLFLSLAPSVKRSNCYMVWGGDIVATSQRASRSNVDLEIGCLVDLAMGMLSFSANGRELGTCYQVGAAPGAVTAASPAWCSGHSSSAFSIGGIPTTAHGVDVPTWSCAV